MVLSKKKKKGFSAIHFPWELGTTSWRKKVAKKEAGYEHIFQSHTEQTY